jgi:spermidine/putrescine transport system substrate-binding protein
LSVENPFDLEKDQSVNRLFLAHSADLCQGVSANHHPSSITLVFSSLMKNVAKYNKAVQIIGFMAGLVVAAALLAGCTVFGYTLAPSAPTQGLVLYSWEAYMPQPILDAFAAEYGVTVSVLTYNSQEEAMANIRSGAVAYDIATIENVFIPQLVADNMLAEIDLRHIPNFKNIYQQFRDMAYDPDNKHSIPYNWGTTGLLVRSDLVTEPITGWADLWNPRYAGKIGVRNQPVEMINIALQSLGYPIGSSDPAQLEAALVHLLKLKDHAIPVTPDAEAAFQVLNDGTVWILQGWNGDMAGIDVQSSPIQYILPTEGTFLWWDNFVIAADSPNKATAELFLDFVLRPENSAQIVEALHFPSANEAARQFLSDDILNNPVIYPPSDYVAKTDFYVSLTEDAQKLYADIWRRYEEEALQSPE